MDKMLKDQVAIVTGGARGIGRSISEKLAAAGAIVMVADLNLEGAQQTATELTQSTGSRCEAAKVDVSSAEDCQRLIDETVEKLGRVDILVNNAGITRDKLLARMTPEDWQLVLNINLNSVYACSKAAIRPMGKQRSGKIISIASVVGIMGNAGQCNYSASKAGIIGFTKSLAREMGSRGITVNAVAPGFIQTAMTDVLSDEVKEGLMKAVPLGRLGQPDEVADAVLFLASPAAKYITGHVLNVDGGMAM